MMGPKATALATWTIFVKEMRETFRDKRAMITITLVSMLLPVAMMISVFYQADSLRQESAPRPINIIGGDYAPLLLQKLENVGYTYREDSNVHLIIPENYQELIETDTAPGLLIKADLSKDRLAVMTLEAILKDHRNTVSQQRIKSAGLPASLHTPFEIRVEDQNSVTMEQNLLREIAPLLVMLLLMTPIYGLMPASIDCTAGEKERNGLFPILLQPIPPLAIATGKWMMLVAVGMTGLTISVSTAYLCYLRLITLLDTTAFSIPFSVCIMFLVCAAPTVMLLSALMMGFASYAKSFKEGQTYVGLFSILPLTFIMGGYVVEERWRTFMPFWTEIQVIAALIAGETPPYAPWHFMIGVYAVIILLTLYWMSRTMNRNALKGAM
ncbi:sodium ABC transporter permease [Kordiimonas sediminis]|uniref:Sodium ABC transporter permease n=1 Tax=Kordiimonas sediminis TaxID=1735581 RepID=A0A919E8D9_9PROT|nr:ABC transporter permease [Kordiimonas sediminis]GHF24557.1 sodium ABC transporter permease [Kordiimonas sediminis]